MPNTCGNMEIKMSTIQQCPKRHAKIHHRNSCGDPRVSWGVVSSQLQTGLIRTHWSQPWSPAPVFHHPQSNCPLLPHIWSTWQANPWWCPQTWRLEFSLRCQWQQPALPQWSCACVLWAEISILGTENNNLGLGLGYRGVGGVSNHFHVILSQGGQGVNASVGCGIVMV